MTSADLRDFGIIGDNSNIDIDKISNVEGPISVEQQTMPEETTLGIKGYRETFSSFEGFTDKVSYQPPCYRMIGNMIGIIPHHILKVTVDGKYVIFHYNNIGWKKIGFSNPVYSKKGQGKVDPRIYKLKEFFIKCINKDEKSNSKFFDGNKDVNDDSYQLFLVEKYNIRKNDTLNKYVLNSKPYNDLIEVLTVAHELETTKTNKLMKENNEIQGEKKKISKDFEIMGNKKK